MPPLLEVRDLRTGYGAVPVLHGVSFSVEEGATAVMLGLNGAGKTTTLISIAGLLKPWGGQILYDGQNVAGEDARPPLKRGLGLIPGGRPAVPGPTPPDQLRPGPGPGRQDPQPPREKPELRF